MSTLTERMKKLPRTRRAKVEARAAALIAEELALQELRAERSAVQGQRGLRHPSVDYRNKCGNDE